MLRKYLLLSLMAISAQIMMAQTQITLASGGRTLTATLVDNHATQELVSLLSDGPVTLLLEDYGGFEKVGPLPQALPASDTRITTEPGDIMLYQGNKIVIFYGSNTWSYTPLGKIDGASVAKLQEFLGSGSVELTISLSANTAVEQLTAAPSGSDALICDINGRTLTQRPLPPGIYIVNGRKTLIP